VSAVALALALCYLLVLGYLPALAISRSPALAAPPSGLTAGLVVTVALVGSLVTRSPLLPWVVAAAVGSWAASLLTLTRTGPPQQRLVVRPAAVAVVAAISAVVLAGSTAAPTEWDAHMIWFFHASWFSAGGDVAREAMANPALATSHADYPPLASASAAGLWSIADGGSLRLAQAVTSVQSWMAVVLAGCLAMSAARREAQLLVAGLAGAFALASFGVAGGFGTRGYADLLWAAAMVSAVLAFLVLPPTATAQLVGATCLAAAMLTKAEAFVSAFAVFIPLVVLRAVREDRRAALRRLRPVLGAVGAATCWPVLAGRFAPDAKRDITVGSLRALLTGDPAKVDRLSPALSGLVGYTRLTFVTAGVAIVAGCLVLRRDQRRDLGGPWWLPAAAVGCFVLFFVVVAAADVEVHFYVATGGFRTMTVVRMLLLAEVLVTAAVFVDRAVGRRIAASGPGDGGLAGGERRRAGPAPPGRKVTALTAPPAGERSR
jgi:hypothetical protein